MRGRAVRVVDGVHVPTKQKREEVCKLVSCGLSVEEIGFVLGCMEHEVRSHYAQEIEHGSALTTAMVGASMLKQALRGDVNAARFWLQSRARWTIPQHVELTGKDGGPVQIEARRALVARVLELATKGKGNATHDAGQEDQGQQTLNS
jgi:hypothetical protein